MRIFTLILSLIVAAACIFLNVLGYNGTLSFVQFLLINSAAELLLCLILGHFMYRTYANRKRAKSLAQELTNAQAALQLKEKEAASAKTASVQAENKLAALQVDLSALQDKLTAAEKRAADAPAHGDAPSHAKRSDIVSRTRPQAPVTLGNTQTLSAPENGDATDPAGTTTLYKAPLA